MFHISKISLFYFEQVLDSEIDLAVTRTSSSEVFSKKVS